MSSSASTWIRARGAQSTPAMRSARRWRTWRSASSTRAMNRSSIRALARGRFPVAPGPGHLAQADDVHQQALAVRWRAALGQAQEGVGLRAGQDRGPPPYGQDPASKAVNRSLTLLLIRALRPQEVMAVLEPAEHGRRLWVSDRPAAVVRQKIGLRHIGRRSCPPRSRPAGDRTAGLCAAGWSLEWLGTIPRSWRTAGRRRRPRPGTGTAGGGQGLRSRIWRAAFSCGVIMAWSG